MINKFLIFQVKEFIAHTAAVNDLCFDIEGEYIGSCSDDGSVVINSLFTEERLKFEYHRPMKAIALDPDYVRKASRRFVTGGLAGHLYYNVKKWIGYRDQVYLSFQLCNLVCCLEEPWKTICHLPLITKFPFPGFALW